MEIYFNQRLVWDRVTGTDHYSEDVYERGTITGRKETSMKIVNDPMGVELVSAACVFTAAPVTTGDLVDGRLVIHVEENINLDGVNAWNEVYLL